MRRFCRYPFLVLVLFPIGFALPGRADLIYDYIPISESGPEAIEVVFPNITWLTGIYDIRFCEENIGVPCNANTPADDYSDRVLLYNKNYTNLGGVMGLSGLFATIDFYSDPAGIPAPPPQRDAFFQAEGVQPRFYQPIAYQAGDPDKRPRFTFMIYFWSDSVSGPAFPRGCGNGSDCIQHTTEVGPLHAVTSVIPEPGETLPVVLIAGVLLVSRRRQNRRVAAD